VSAHGGVALADDVCVMSLGNLSAHFAIYQPKTRQSREFCEDIPDASEALFVIDFIHDVLGTMDVEFRIIRDVANTQLSTTWEDVLAIDDIESATLFYSEPQRYQSGSMKLRYQFEDKGYYVGIINATNNAGKEFRAVFPFRVGGQTFWTYLPLFAGLLLLLELFFWLNRDKQHVSGNDDNNYSTGARS